MVWESGHLNRHGFACPSHPGRVTGWLLLPKKDTCPLTLPREQAPLPLPGSTLWLLAAVAAARRRSGQQERASAPSSPAATREPPLCLGR